MSRRICLLVLAVSFALAAPAATFAQSSSQAQYQGVAPETSTPVTGSGGSPGGGGTTGGGTTSGGSATGTGGSAHTGGTTSGASGNGGSGASAPASAPGDVVSKVATPDASNDTSAFSGTDILWFVVALAGLTGLAFLLRRTKRTPAGT